jgi:hypothetical protein
MPETTLKRIHEVLPNVELQRTYGLSELGILRSNKAHDSRPCHQWFLDTSPISNGGYSMLLFDERDG